MEKTKEAYLQSLEELQRQIGYRFQNTDLLVQALTHSSYANETGVRNHHLLCNERLEFLGDSVLSLVCSSYLYKRNPNLPEGGLTGIRSAVVCEEALASFAERISLGKYLRLGKGELHNGGAERSGMRADAFEALLAAIYLDSGNRLEAVEEFLIPYLRLSVDALSTSKDSKSLLQELIQQDGACSPEYRIVKEEGPDHAKHYEAEVYLDSNCIGKGSGSSKRHAEQAAAADALHLFGMMGNETL